MIAIDRGILFGKMRARWSLTGICVVPLHKIKWSSRELRTNRSMLQTNHTKFCTNEPLRTIRRAATTPCSMRNFTQIAITCILCLCFATELSSRWLAEWSCVLLVGCPARELADGRRWITWNARDLYDRPSPRTCALFCTFRLSVRLRQARYRVCAV